MGIYQPEPLVVQNLSDLPAVSAAGEFAFVMATGRHYMYSGGAWYIIANNGEMGAWVGTTWVPGAQIFSTKVTTVGGIATVNLTNGPGGPAFSNVYLDTVNVSAYSDTTNVQPGARILSGDLKTLTINVRQILLGLGILSLATASNGTEVNVNLIVKP